MHALFYTRLLLYMLAMIIPVIHPSIVVPYDKTGWLLWFLLMPGEMFIAYYLSPPKFPLRVWFGSAVALLAVFIVIFSPFDSYTLLAIGIGAGSFLITAFIFKLGQRAETLFFIEPFFLIYLYYKLLSFSRASEATASRSSGFTQILLFLIVGAFLLHGIVLFLAAFPENRRFKGKKELYVFGLGVLPVLLIVAFLLPPDFVNHSVVMNLLDREADPEPVPLDIDGDGIPDNGNLNPRRPREDDGKGQGERADSMRNGRNRNGENGDESSLEGIPSDEWNNSAEGKGKNNQRAVMVVATDRDSVYAAEEYRGFFDSEQGFSRSMDEPLNELPYLRFLDTWTDRDPPADSGRERREIFFLSTRSERHTAYRPSRIEPTVLTRKFHPFEFSYHTVSNMSTLEMDDWQDIGELVEEEAEENTAFLELPLPPETKERFIAFLGTVLNGDERYGEKIDKLLKSFSEHQYELGYAEDVSPERMVNFLLNDRRGDCTEFSNTAAILARLAGIPSRVVIGYLASEGLQSDSHRRGVTMLRQSIDLLQEYPLDDLLLVTTAHRHSWVQFFIPGRGWVDFESTMYALPPPPGEDPNSAEVVIPLLQDRSGERARTIPWGLILTILGSVAAGSVVLVYTWKGFRLAYLGVLSRGTSVRSLKALSKLLLMKYAYSGYPLKRPAVTLLEYAELRPEFVPFAVLYNRLRYQGEIPENRRNELWRELRSEASKLKKHWKKSGFRNLVRRIFSLRGLYY